MFMKTLLFATVFSFVSPPETLAEAGPKETSNPIDGASMVYVEAGEFIRGATDSAHDERPQRRILLDGFWIYRYEVTVWQYKKYCSATGKTLPEAPWWEWNDENPMTHVTWEEAAAYAEWAGGSLPTEAQWEKAARGTDGRICPWGNTWDPTSCNNGQTEPVEIVPPGSFPKDISPYGCYDMAGNVWEWCSDWYDPNYYAAAPEKNPKGPPSGRYRVRRSCGYEYYSPYAGRCSSRFFIEPGNRGNNFGFRVVVEKGLVP